MRILLALPFCSAVWYITKNENNIYSRCDSPTKCEDGVVPLGTTDSIEACEKKAADPKYTSFTWHHKDFSAGSEYARHCFGITDGKWLDEPQDQVDSGSHHKDPAKACTTMEDCSYNGKCTDSGCQCNPQFTGDACDRFNFEDLDLAKGSGLRTIDSSGEQVSSWGGSVLLADDGKYHMWAAEMTHGTGIKAWLTNSQVVHAVADDPDAPFKFTRKEVVMPVFAHEPTVARAPTGEYVMYFTTNFGEEPGSQCGPPCTCGNNGTSCLSCDNDQQCTTRKSPLSTRMSIAKNPDGPWSTPVLVPAPTAGDTNLACVIRPNASLVCLGRPGLGLMYSPDWRDVKSYVWHGEEYGRGEDPMVWREEVEDQGAEGDGRDATATREVLHAITHGGGWGDPFGYHYWSTDGGFNWKGTNNKVYENIVPIAGTNQTKILSRRERPHIVLNKAGIPIGLTNGVTEAWPCTLQQEPDRPPCKHPYTPGVNPDCGPGSNGTSIWCPEDYCYTLYQPLKLQ